MRRDTRRTGVFTRRALLMMGGQVALMGGLAARLYQVQVVEGGRYSTLAKENRNGASHTDNAAADAIVLRIVRRVVILLVLANTQLSSPLELRSA